MLLLPEEQRPRGDAPRPRIRRYLLARVGTPSAPGAPHAAAAPADDFTQLQGPLD